MSMYNFSLYKCHNSYIWTSFRISFSYIDRVQNLNSASMSRGNLPSWKSGIASHGGLTANANWRKDGNKETYVSLSSLVVQILHLKNQRLFFEALYAKEETDSFCFVNSDHSVFLSEFYVCWTKYIYFPRWDGLSYLWFDVHGRSTNILWFCNTCKN